MDREYSKSQVRKQRHDDGNRFTAERSDRKVFRTYGEKRERNFNRKDGDFRERTGGANGKPEGQENQPRRFPNRYTSGYHAGGGRNDRQPQQERKHFEKRENFRRPQGEEGKRRYDSRDDRRHSEGQRERRPYGESAEKRPYTERRPRFNREEREPADRKEIGGKTLYRKRNFKEEGNFRRERKEYSPASKEGSQRIYSKKKVLEHKLKHAGEESELRLNRYISMGGICSRRDADELIRSGRVKVNGEVVDTVGVKVKRTDKVEVDDVAVFPERKVYLVLNKPKDYVTTVEDPLERKTVMALVEGACKERVYPIGRLDRQTTGVLLFTNDGDLAKKLTHPKYEHKKIYHVFLDKAVAPEDLDAIAQGVELEDGFIQADEVSFASEDRTEVGIEIHSGKNRIVRRIFEHFGYQIVKLDRVYFAGITKKNLPRGQWRFLTPREVNILKYY